MIYKVTTVIGFLIHKTIFPTPIVELALFNFKSLHNWALWALQYFCFCLFFYVNVSKEHTSIASIMQGHKDEFGIIYVVQ